MKKYKSIFLSDIHLGYNICDFKNLIKLLNSIEVENIFLIGDIFSISSDENHQDIQDFLKFINSSKSNIFYILGNHEKERKKPRINIYHQNKKIEPLDEYIYISNGKKIYLVHGDEFHNKDIFNKMLKKALIAVKKTTKKRISKKKHPYKSHRATIYHTILKPIMKKLLYDSYREYLYKETIKRDCKMVICGHIHQPDDCHYKTIRYLNCGDWLAYSSYITEDLNGNFKLNKF